ncbi:MAG: OmpA family protein [Alphaproteobacteria bacterium]
MRFPLIAAACAGILMVTSGCAQLNFGGGAFTADDDIAFAKSKTASDPFGEALRQGYLQRAEAERAEYDYRDAGLFAEKAVDAANGNIPGIWSMERWDLAPEHHDNFAKGQTMLLDALNRGGAIKAPGPMAKAQTSFECWAQEAEENHQPKDIGACWADFMAAMAAVEEALKPKMAPKPTAMAEPPASDYLVFFDFDRSEIRADSASILNSVINAVRELKTGTVELIGHADRAGATTYNQRLSERRAEAVRQYLAGRGLSVQTTIAGRGESDPRVPTADGVREQENRRVEIHLK